ncbi:MEGF10 [Branchiostoma lanceolatum]|uniref:MEGF10 protein n=1 Tax=Branchiostoma lanceolatum TaxID=7740 RepID=A0A8K0EFP4_BRALA|nr:MEGF10 [Branchiostoma lanceolatum]
MCSSSVKSLSRNVAGKGRHATPPVFGALSGKHARSDVDPGLGGEPAGSSAVTVWGVWSSRGLGGCPLGFHGKSCAPVCRCQNNAGCNLVTGECYCRSGFTGEFCEETCPEGFYGVNCRYRCHHCHSGTSCDRRTGACYANPSFATSDSNKDLALGAQLTANGALIGGFLLVFVLMIVLVAVIVFFRRKLKEERQRRMESISSVL